MRSKNFLFISVLTLLAAIAWVFFDAYHAYTTNTITPVLEEIALPLTPKIDKAVIQKLKERHEPVNIFQSLITVAEFPARTASESATATASGIRR